MSGDRKEKEKQRLRKYLNPVLRGPNVDAVLEAISGGPCHLIQNLEAVNDQLYVATASGRYLDQLLGGKNITRPDNIGLPDDIFRELGIEISNRKQVKDLIHQILRIMYGEELIRATVRSDEFEPYQLEDGDTLRISFDDKNTVEVNFKSSQFTNINSASAQEVADAITKEIRRLGRTGAAFAKDDGIGGYVTLISETNGSPSTVRVLGGKAQNKLKFAQIRPTSSTADTEWSLTQENGGIIRATWIEGSNPQIGKVEKNDYVNIYGSKFKDDMLGIDNRGTFTIIEARGGNKGEAYVEFLNPTGSEQLVGTQDDLEAILFFNPVRKGLNSKTRYAAAYQTESRLLEIFIPATTKVVRRNRQGAAHLHDTGASEIDQLGPYSFDTTKGYLISQEECNTTIKVNGNSGLVIEVDDASEIPDEQGFLIFGFGTSKEEGPVPYISRPSDNSILLNPSYRFRNNHDSGTNISLVSLNSVYRVSRDGSDYPFYITDIVAGRIYSEDLIKLITATGIRLVITVLYPNDIGLAKWGTENSDKFYVWGEDPE
jgi:hypothetical protein